MHYKRDFVISLKETRAFYLDLALRSWLKGFWGFGLAGALTAWLYLGRFFPAENVALRVLISVVTGLVVVAAATGAMAVVTTLRVRRDFRRSGRDHYIQHTEIDGFGVRVTAQGRQAKVGFDKLLLVRETGGAFYLHLTPNQAWILPKGQMEDRAEECAQLRGLFSAVIPSRQLKIKKN